MISPLYFKIISPIPLLEPAKSRAKLPTWSPMVKLEGIRPPLPLSYPQANKLIHRLSTGLSPTTIFTSCLNVMTAFAKSLPVTLVPKKHHISFMGFNMIHYFRRCQFPFTFTRHTKRVLFQKPFTRLAPAAAIASTCCGTTSAIVFLCHLLLMLVTITIRRKFGTTRVGTWTTRFHGHPHITFPLPLSRSVTRCIPPCCLSSSSHRLQILRILRTFLVIDVRLCSVFHSIVYSSYRIFYIQSLLV
ncbi:hypothetical protein UF75_1218 [Desulfosporosinus sp. I2]|nr:hypothetical protein UF75_1218 [Desulfosporosinus sp. I2]